MFQKILLLGLITFLFIHLAASNSYAQQASSLITSGIVFNTDSSAKISRSQQSSVRVPENLINTSTGWVAGRIKMGFPSNTTLSPDPIIFDMSQSDTNSHFIYYDVGSDTFHFERTHNGTLASTVQSFAVGTLKTVIVAWTPTQIKISIDGSPFTVANNAFIAPESAFYIGSTGIQGNGRQPDSDYYWVAGGTGVLTDANAAAINSFGNNDKRRSEFSGNATFIWWASTNQYNNDGAATNTPTRTATSAPTGTCPSVTTLGDANNDNKVDGLDFSVWLNHYNQSLRCATNGDFNNSNLVDGVDFSIWLTNYGHGIQTPTPSGPTPTNPPVGEVKGIWLSTEEIMRLPQTGSAWDKVNAAANSNWGSACLYDLTCNHDVNTLAGALVAVRTNNASLRAKTIAGLTAATQSNLDRVLELSRGLQTYIIAADIIGYHDPTFEAWVKRMVSTSLQGHSGGGNLLETAEFSSNNWGGHARASLAAAALYLQDQSMLSSVTAAHKAFIGVSAPGNRMTYTSTNWHFDNSNAGENRKGSVRNGISISGVLPEDWRRSEEFKWPPTVSGYMWEGMQGYIVTAVILHRASIVTITSGDNALMRAMDILYHKGEAVSNPTWTNPASGDDTWIPWVANYYLNEDRYPTDPSSIGKNMGWTDWTHAR